MAFLVLDLQVRTDAIRVDKHLTRVDEYLQVWFYLARAIRSVPPPGANGTRIVTLCAG
jgi:hypothetical protein